MYFELYGTHTHTHTHINTLHAYDVHIPHTHTHTRARTHKSAPPSPPPSYPPPHPHTIAQDLTPSDTVKIIEALRKGQEPKINSQYRNKAEPRGTVVDGKWVPSSGTTTLTSPPPGPFVANPDL